MADKDQEDYEKHTYKLKITGKAAYPSLDWMFDPVDVITEEKVDEDIYELEIGTHSNNHYWLSTGTEEVPLGIEGYDEDHISVEVLEAPDQYTSKDKE